MNTLFPLEPAFPQGFAYLPDFIDNKQEEDLLHAISKEELHQLQFRGYEAKRKVASFGYDWSFEKRTLSKGRDIPGAFRLLVEKVAAHLSISERSIAELLITEYPAGSMINWHRDAPPFDIIAGVSLCSDCVFRLRPCCDGRQKKSSVVSFPVQRRSLYIIRGSARKEWEHSIAPAKQVRYSITLRTLKSHQII